MYAKKIKRFLKFSFIGKLFSRFRKKKESSGHELYDGTKDVEVTAYGGYRASDYTCISFQTRNKKTEK